MAISRDQLAAIVAASPFAIHAIDRERRVTWCNAAAERLYGWTLDELIDRPLPTIPDDARAWFDANCARVFAGESLRAAGVARLRKDGGRFVVNLSVAPMRDADG